VPISNVFFGFLQGYWVWGKLVEALADCGYDTNNLVTAAFDWR